MTKPVILMTIGAMVGTLLGFGLLGGEFGHSALAAIYDTGVSAARVVGL